MSRQKKPLRNSFWDNADFPIAVAHRGGDGAGIEKENSLKAFQAAYDLGYRWFETDVVPTKDGELLAIHGRGYQRHPNKDLPSRIKLQKMSYREAKKKVRVGKEEILTLEKLFETFPDVKFFLDPKTIKAAPALAKFLQSRPDDIYRVWVGSFIPFNNSRVYRHVKRSTGKCVGLALLGPIKSLPIKTAARFYALKPFVRFYVKWTRAGSVRAPYSWILQKQGEDIVRLSHDLGLKVGVYTPNSQPDIKTCVNMGVDVVMSDDLDNLQKIIKSK